LVATLSQVFRRLRYYFEMRGAGRSGSAPPPSERTWVHPSELPGSFDQAAMPPARVAGSRRFKALVATSASVLLLTGGVLLAQPTDSQLAGASTGPHVATTFAALPPSDRHAAQSMLALVIYEGQHLGTATAMVLPPGDLAVTTTPVPKGASVMGGVLGQRSVALEVVGTDAQLGVTLLQLPTTVEVTPIAPLGPAVSTGGAPTALTALAAVRGTTTPTEFAYAAAYLTSPPAAATVGRSVIAVTHGKSLAGVIAGTLVLDGSGRAVAAQVPALGSTSFVSATFLRLLAERIVLGNASDHGWLQLVGAATSTGAARVLGVTYRGATWGKVLAGDTIVAINSVRVRTMADVGSILYTSSPGQPVDLTVLRDGHTKVVDVVLAASP
jgi:putative serine protease PepD